MKPGLKVLLIFYEKGEITIAKIITFPHMDNYYIPIKYIIENTTNQKVLVPPKITKKTKIKFLHKQKVKSKFSIKKYKTY